MQDVNLLKKRVEPMYRRLSELYKTVDVANVLSPDLLPMVLKELGIVSETLQIAMEELVAQNEELLLANRQIEIERQRYWELFDLTVESYVMTDREGIIQQANHAAVELLKTQRRLLLDKSICDLIHPDDREKFQLQLEQMPYADRHEFAVRLQSYSGNQLDCLLVSLAIRDAENSVIGWCWRIHPQLAQTQISSLQPSYDLLENRSLVNYRKGDTIPLESQSIWVVAQGVVKLTTLSDAGMEMLIGVVQEGMIFGSCLTTLPIYQAIALLDTHLAAIPLAEVSRSPVLAQMILPKVGQRLQQAEAFLTIYGQMRVEDRLNRFLGMLKQLLGQPSTLGTRLRVRLTHQDLANACCTTRVTMTRLLNKLQQEGKLELDEQNHLLLKD